MATPRKGAVIRPFGGAAIERISGRLANPAQPTSDSLAVARYFSPGVQYFPSGVPMAPVAPEGSATARQWDFPAFLNLAYLPRSEQGETAITYETLRLLASPEHGGLDVLRLVIETRKDQMAAQRWAIRSKEDKNDDGGPRGRQTERWLKRPDGVNTFRAWARMLLEENFVLGASCVYYGGSKERPLWELIDAATIKRLIDPVGGRTPLPPLPAYQQIIKGLPAEDYTLDELGYYVYNPMVNRVYGVSPVAQILMTINQALNRGLSQLEYFTAGTVPDAFMELPKEWTQERIEQWQEWFNSELEGQLGERRKVRFVPQGANYKETKAEVLKDLYDEWLARIVCFAFSIPPQPFIKETNRATADTAKEAAMEEGLEPLKLWFKDIMDDLLERAGCPDLEFYWTDEEITDPEVKAKVIQSYYGGATGGAKPIITLAEARSAAGLAPATPEQLAELAGGDPGGTPAPPEPKTPPPPPAVAPEPPGPAAPSPDQQKIAKAGRPARGRSLPPVDHDPQLVARTERRVKRQVGAVLTRQRLALYRALAAHVEKAAGTDPVTPAELRALIAAVEAEPWSTEAQDALRAALEALAQDAGRRALEQVRAALGGETELGTMLNQVNLDAVAWATERVGNLITQVSGTTRDLVNQIVANAIESGLTNQQLADRLGEAFLFGQDRALMIARTETQFAANYGALTGYRASGVVARKAWVGEDPCEECQMNVDAGDIPINETFPTGDDAPPAHPNCKCSIVPVVPLAAGKLAGLELAVGSARRDLDQALALAGA